MNDTDTATLDEPITPPTTSATGVVATSPVDDIRAQAAAEVERIAAIRRICAGKNAGLEARAIREGWDAQRIELEILRTTRPSAPAVHVPDNSVTATTAACGGRWCG